MNMEDLLNLSCKHYPPDTPAMDTGHVTELLTVVPGWESGENNDSITRSFKFKNFHETMAFIDAAAEIIHLEDHHPDIAATYNTCTLTFSTHTVKGLSLNDFICAAKINQLV